ncbi:MAG: autotransporter domain-containing protein [Rubrivivax sp.]|jgi:hypothetical protein|nr:autotransporter domain-containing protein [Rubrivivax sp.]
MSRALRRPGARHLLGAGLLGAAGTALAQGSGGPGATAPVDVQRIANGVLGVMSYAVAPDVTTSSLAIENAATSNPALTMVQFGGGFTWSDATPLYLEGNAAYASYDPVFIASAGGDQRPLPVQWRAVSATGGVGWDFPIAGAWVFRPLASVTLGHVASDLTAVRWWRPQQGGDDLDFLDSGQLEAYGLGGALMIDYQSRAPDLEDDLELRYTHVELRSYADSSEGVRGQALAESLSLWARRRTPTGLVVWDRPLRWVFEGAYTRFLGSETKLGIDRIASLGVGLELDASAHEAWLTRWRAVVRYRFGPDVLGWSVGLAAGF